MTKAKSKKKRMSATQDGVFEVTSQTPTSEMVRLLADIIEACEQSDKQIGVRVKALVGPVLLSSLASMRFTYGADCEDCKDQNTFTVKTQEKKR